MGPINIVMGNQNQLFVKKVQNSIVKHSFDVLKICHATFKCVCCGFFVNLLTKFIAKPMSNQMCVKKIRPLTTCW
jgi:hypothetical protein